MLIELFLLGRTAEALRTKIDRKSAISLQRGHFDPKFQVARNVSDRARYYTRNSSVQTVSLQCFGVISKR